MMSLPKIDLPREKLQRYGVKRLADQELLAVLLGSGIQGLNVLQLSKKILELIFRVGRTKITQEHLLSIRGLGQVRAGQILSLLELTNRFCVEKTEVLSPADVWKLCSDMRDSKREHFVAFYLDTQGCLIERQIISIGTLNASLVHPRELFEPAITLRAATVIVAHNHPSGSTTPSTEDIEMTKKLVHAGKILDIFLTDHVIVTKNAYLSIIKYHINQDE